MFSTNSGLKKQTAGKRDAHQALSDKQFLRNSLYPFISTATSHRKRLEQVVQYCTYLRMTRVLDDLLRIIYSCMDRGLKDHCGNLIQ